MRRVLSQVAHAAVKTKGSKFQAVFRRLVTRLGHNKAIWAIAHRLCRLTWKILHQGVRYMELGTRSSPKLIAARTNKLVRTSSARLSSATFTNTIALTVSLRG